MHIEDTLERIACELDTLADDDWRETGVSARTIVSIGITDGMNVYIHDSQHKHENRGKRVCLCFAVEGDHAWFYETESARRSIAHLDVSSNESVNHRAMVAHDFESTRAEYRTWQ